jgi:MscS family membrane protein
MDYPILGWKTQTLIVSLAVFILSLTLARYGRHLLRKACRNYVAENRIVAAAVSRALSNSLGLLFIVTGVAFAITQLGMDKPLDVAESMAMEAGTAEEQEPLNVPGLITALYILAITYMLYCLVDVPLALLRRTLESRESQLHQTVLPLMGKILRVVILILGGVTIIQTIWNLNFAGLLAGLGVGSLAVALAAQETIRNFFGSVMLVGDRPFEVGERIIVEGHDGPVESVGMRSTRIRTLEGHLVTIPNGELANKSILNIGRRPHIRRLSTIGVTYDTPHEKVERAVEILRDILKDHEGMDPDFPPRVYFQEFADFSLNILMILWYHPPAYWDFMEFNQRVNLEILRRFNEEGIEFAFPSQTLYHQMVNNGENDMFLKKIGEEISPFNPGASPENNNSQN